MPLTSKNTRILLVEDQTDLAAAIGTYFESLGCVMDYAADGQVALNLAESEHYDCIIMDLTLPKLDGLEVCRRTREQGSSVPVLMLTARDQLTDKLDGFEVGADDYLVKPFEMDELVARVSALVRRQRGEVGEELLSVHDLHYDQHLVQVRRAGQKITLSPTCLRILKILLRESPRLVTRESLENELWGDLLPDSDTLRSHLYNLRKAIDRPFDIKLLHTIQGVGFKLAHPNDV